MENLVVTEKSDFWFGKRVLLTGHTGFKGSWLALWLQRMGAEISGIALAPNTSPNLFELAKLSEGMDSQFCDVRDREAIDKIVRRVDPEIVFHLAAQPLVRASYDDPVTTFDTNVMGTTHVLDALRGLSTARVAVMVTTDKVYANNEWCYPYRETDTLGGHDPYSASKAASEIVIASYRDAFLKQQGLAVASARAGNVIGGGDWSEDRLIPDAVRAWQSDEALDIRRPDAIRPWQHVLEPLFGYLTLAEKLWHQPELAGAFNFGPPSHEAATVRHVIEVARDAFGQGAVRFGEGNAGPHEAGWLSLETGKARATLGLNPQWNLTDAVSRTMDWYRDQFKGAEALSLCEADIDAYESGL
ncbi:CDP-glucose 4,6-dehydratase [Pseudohongiella acticola]|uniref:CDP-glucose 4,6-dehydratase n=1 Tax=Pseudohongiella acticola TaxID=1524254 RepID=A0A1E8CH75_9GAMM|nr:CDP-glucose 4,6-dehydratase [Pseudohongiella acticola]OFE11749.1 CDP-glucose 4,6-dehydratase [Pseudohongiella acticola]